MKRTVSFASIAALALVSASSAAFTPPPPKTPTTTISFTRQGATTLTVSGVQVSGGWKQAMTKTGVSTGMMATNMLNVSVSLGRIDSYTAQIDGTTATVGAFSFSITRPQDLATGQATGQMDGVSIALHRTAATTDDWKTWMTKTHGSKAVTLRALSAGSEVRAYAFSSCAAASYDFVANADGTVDDTLGLMCVPTVTETGGALAPAFADLLVNRAYTNITVASPGRTAMTFAQGGVMGYALLNGTETYSLSARNAPGGA